MADQRHLVLGALALRFTEGFTAAAPALLRSLDALRAEVSDLSDRRWLWASGNNVSGIIAQELFDAEVDTRSVSTGVAKKCVAGLVAGSQIS